MRWGKIFAALFMMMGFALHAGEKSYLERVEKVLEPIKRASLEIDAAAIYSLSSSPSEWKIAAERLSTIIGLYAEAIDLAHDWRDHIGTDTKGKKNKKKTAEMVITLLTESRNQWERYLHAVSNRIAIEE